MNQKLKIALVVVGVLILGAVILAVISNKKVRQDKNQKVQDYKDGRAASKQQFSDLLKELQNKNILSNSEEFLNAYDKASQDPTKLVQLTASTFKQNPRVGLQMMSQLCVNFYEPGKANEMLHDELSLLFYNDRENFLEGLTGDFKDENMNCLLNNTNIPTTVSEKPGFDYNVERKKIVDYLTNHRLKDNQNVLRLIERFGH